ncbi:MAG TPA: hypothetical protein VMV44_06395 [Rectinemataceae bacterium]|nr:hypothetical protein [Rectinemataceae bacterium]
MAILLASSAPRLAAEEGGTLVEFSFGLSSDEASALRADIRTGDSRLAFAVRGDETEAEVAFSAAYAGKEGGGIAVGSLHPGPILLLLLDPLEWGLVGRDPHFALPDANLDSSLGGCVINAGSLSLFALGRGGFGTGGIVMEGEEKEEEDDSPPSIVAGGLSAQFPLGSNFLGFSLGIGRSKQGNQPSSWYDAFIPGSWPRSLGSLFFWAPRPPSRITLALIASSAIDLGSGLALRLELGQSLAGALIHASIAARSPHFLAWNEKGDRLARGQVEVELPLGNDLRLALRGELAALATFPEPSPHLERVFRFSLDGEGRAAFPARLRFDGSWKAGPEDSALGSAFELGLGESDDTFRLGLSAVLEWAGTSALLVDRALEFFALVPPDLLELRLEAVLPRFRLPGAGLMVPSLHGSLERRLPFEANPANAFTVEAGWGLEIGKAGLFTFTLRGDFEGSPAPSLLASLGSAPGRLRAGLRVGLGR